MMYVTLQNALLVYRSRSDKNLEDSTLRFLSSGKADIELIYYDILGTQAHCIMLREIGILSVSELEQILHALVKLEGNPALIDLSTFEDVHESLEAFVIDQTEAQIGGKMHSARSRNDQVVLDMRMKIRDDLNNTSGYLLDLIHSLLKKASENINTIILLYTHSQQAQIGTFSHLLLSYVETLFRDLDRLYVVYDRVNTCPLGGGAIGGSSIRINRDRTAVLLGFRGLVINSIDATSSRDTMCEYVSSLGIIMITLSRIAADLILWSTSEFGYIDISDENSSTSSAMPQKKNPDPLEIIRGKSGSLLGSLNSVFSIVKSLPTGYSRDLQEIKPALWEASNSVQDSLQILRIVIDSLYVHRERMEQMALKSYAISIDIAEMLVVNNRIPFRSAHKIIGALVEKAISNGNLPLSELKKEQIKEILQRLNSNLKVEDIMQIIANLTPEVSVSLRLSEGSPNPKYQQRMIDELNRKALDYEKALSDRKRHISESLDALRKEVKNYLPDLN
ncbi:MAG TPA: argininosuccinate lyase [Nitrososphaeraceae archaeon]